MVNALHRVQSSKEIWTELSKSPSNPTLLNSKRNLFNVTNPLQVILQPLQDPMGDIRYHCSSSYFSFVSPIFSSYWSDFHTEDTLLFASTACSRASFHDDSSPRSCLSSGYCCSRHPFSISLLGGLDPPDVIKLFCPRW